MPHSSVVVSLPAADRRTSFTFYRDGLGFDAIGEPAEDGVPEPLQFALNDGVRLMLVPSGGVSEHADLSGTRELVARHLRPGGSRRPAGRRST